MTQTTTTPAALRAAVTSAATLRDLCAALNAMERAYTDALRTAKSRTPADDDEQAADEQVRDARDAADWAGVNTSDLPTFGGEEPRETPVWSWDHDSVLLLDEDRGRWTWTVTPRACECAGVTDGSWRCDEQPTPADAVVLWVIPASDRETHRAAGGWRVDEAHGAQRYRVARSCAAALATSESEREWVRVEGR